MPAQILVVAQAPTPTPVGFWATPTPVPTSASLPLDFSNAVPTLVENYARSAEYAVQSWNTFTSPVSGFNNLLILFMVAIILFGVWRVYAHVKRSHGQDPLAGIPGGD